MRCADHVGEVGGPARFPAGHRGRRLGQTALRRVEVRAVRGEQAADVDHVDPGAGLPLGQAVGHHRPDDLLADANASRAGAEHRDPLLAQPRPGGCSSGGERGQDNGCSALDVIVEGQQLTAITLQDGQGVRGGEVLPLQQDARQFSSHRLNEPVNEVVVGGTVDTVVPPAEIHGVVEELGVVGADVKENRQRAGRVDPAQRRVQGQLPDRDAHAADALVTQAQDPLPVGDDDDVDLPARPVAQDLPDTVAVGVGDEQPAWPAVDLAEPLAGHPDGGGVEDRQHLLDVVGYQPVEQHLVGVLQRAQVDMPGDVGGLLLVGPVPAADLLVQGLHRGRHQTTQAQLGALRLGEGGAFVRQRILQHPHAGVLIDTHGHSLLIRYSDPFNITRAPAKKPGMHLPVEYKSFDRTFAPVEEQVRGV